MTADNSSVPVYEVLRAFEWAEQRWERGQLIGNGVLPPATLASLVRAEHLRLANRESKDARTLFEVVRPFDFGPRRLRRGDRIVGQELPVEKVGALRRIGWIRPLPDDVITPKRRGRPLRIVEESE